MGGYQNPKGGGEEVVVGICNLASLFGIGITGLPKFRQFRQPCVHTAVVASVPHTLKYNDDTGHAYNAKGM